MLKEYRYQCISKNGKPIRGIVTASNKKKAQGLIEPQIRKHGLKLQSLEKKRDFLYKVETKKGSKIKGRQSAFNKSEVSEALVKMGYKIIKIEPVLFDIAFKPPFDVIMRFIQLSSFLLKEKMAYDKILQIMADEETNPVLKDAIKKIEDELKKGKEGSEVFSKFAHIFGKFPAYMLGLATKSGNMSVVYEATAKFMERTMEYKKSLKQAFMTPAFTLVAMTGAVIYYLVEIFPSTAELFIKFGMDVPPMTQATLDMSYYLADNWLKFLIIFTIPVVILLIWFSTHNGRIARDKMMTKIPVLGSLFHKSSIEIFFRVFSAIYSGAEDNIETLRASAEACRNCWIENGVKEIAIPLMLKEGMPLVPALEEAGVFNQSTLSRLRSGEEVGNVLHSAEMIALFYEKETTYKMHGIIESIQVFIGLFIGIVITALTVISAELALVSPQI